MKEFSKHLGNFSERTRVDFCLIHLLFCKISQLEFYLLNAFLNIIELKVFIFICFCHL